MQITQDQGYRNAALTVEERVENLVQQMTLDEKIGQMTQVEKNSLTPADVVEYAIGSVLSGGGGNPVPNNRDTWTQMVRSFQEPALTTRLGIPLIYGSDAVHGHNNVVGAVIFPHNIGLGATRDSDLVERIGAVTSTEILATGVHWTFAPAVSVPQDIRWGRTYEGFSENTDLVSELGVAFMKGLQRPNPAFKADHVPMALASVKHYMADGGTEWGRKTYYDWLPLFSPPGSEDRQGIDQGDSIVDEETLRRVHLPPYIAAIKAGALNIMVSYSSWQGLKMHAHRYLLTDVLKGELGFDGFLVSDWVAIDQINRDYDVCVVSSINAGVDMVMVPFDFKRFIAAVHKAVESGDITLSRIDDAVRRILRAKFKLGMFEAPLTDTAWIGTVGAQDHREVAREAVRKSQVLLKNEGAVLPLPKHLSSLVIAGQGADDIGLQCGGWTIDWAGRTGQITDGTTLLQALKTRLPDSTHVLYDAAGNFGYRPVAEVGIVMVAEPPYSEGMGDREDLGLSPEYIALITRVRAACKRLVLILYSGRPVIITEVIDQCDAVVASWLPGTEAQGIADVLLGDAPFTGKLSYSWPRSVAQLPLRALLAHPEPPLFPFGYGLTTD